MRSIILSTLFSTLCLLLSAQQAGSIKPADLVETRTEARAVFETATPFSAALQNRSMVTELDQEVVDYTVLDVDIPALKSLATNAPEQLTLSVPPTYGDTPLLLDLVRVDIFTSDFEVTLASNNQAADVDLGIHYRGIIKGDESSVVAISVYEDEVMGLIAADVGNLVLGKLDGDAWTDEHILYNDRNVMHDQAFECGTMDDGIGYKRKDLIYDNEGRAPGDCIRLYIEVDNDIYVNKGGATGTTNYITGLMNQVITLYANESINSVMSQLVLWDVTSPYSSPSSSGMLSDFQANTPVCGTATTPLSTVAPAVRKVLVRCPVTLRAVVRSCRTATCRVWASISTMASARSPATSSATA